MSLVSINNLTIGFRGPPLLDDANCQILAGQRIGLLGRNGAGKTTLLRLLAQELEPDAGDIVFGPNVRVAMLGQDVPQDVVLGVREVVSQGIDLGQLPVDEHWQAEQAIERIMSRMGLAPEGRFETMSSGMKRRVLLAKALVSKPDLLLLDEPTNHLDVEAIEWLEQFLSQHDGAYMFVTHDRMFLRKAAQRILEIDRGHIFDWACDYETFLVRKEQALDTEEKQNALFDKQLADEEKWIRKGIKARRTRNEGRVRALKRMRTERQQRRDKVGTSNLQIQEAERSGNMVIQAKGISFSYPDGASIFSDFSTVIQRQDKVGVLGPNGAGKSTLLKVLLGKLAPAAGDIRLGANLKVAYFDQLRDQLDEDKTVQENVGDGYDTIKLGGRSKHVLGYLQDFLFSPERSRTLVRFLSGGERNRVLLAKLFAKPANLIVLDEPTNDLDAETLDLLEERLSEYEGTILVVSHDREFLNNVVTSTIAFERHGDGYRVHEYVGGYDDWQRQSKPVGSEATSATQQKKPGVSGDANAKGGGPKPSSNRRLSYSEKRELAGLPDRIEELESAVGSFHERMAMPEFYQQDGDTISAAQEELRQIQADLDAAYIRWEELESIAESS